MKEMKITKREFKEFDKNGIITFCPVCIDCAYDIINILLEHYPESLITMTSTNVTGLFVITAIKQLKEDDDIPSEDEVDEMFVDIPF